MTLKYVPDEWDTCSFLGRWTFSVANKLLNQGVKKPLQYDDLMHIPAVDSSALLMKSLKVHYRHSKAFWFVPRLMIALLKMSGWRVLIVAIGTMTESTIRISLPVVLIYLLKSLEEKASLGECYMFAAILGGLGIMQTIVHHVLFFYSMRVGWTWKMACTALIHDRLFYLNGGTMQKGTTSTGMLVNLISNDVARFEEFSVYACFSWEALLEVTAILVILVYILNLPAGFAGVGCSFILIPITIHNAKQFAKYRGQTAAATDQRVRYISELIDGIASVKSYAWETPFFLLIRKLRLVETRNISLSQSLKAVNQGVLFSNCTVCAFVTFAVYWSGGGRLTIPKVFATICLLQVLRMTIGASWLKSIERGSEAVASCHRIEAFLSLVDDSGNGDEDGKHSASSSNSNISTSSNAYISVPNCEDSQAIIAGAVRLELASSVKANQQTQQQSSSPLIQIAKSSYFYGTDPTSPSLTNIELSVSRGEVLMVVGPVGCGKSSLLAAVLGEISMVPDGTATANNTATNSKRVLDSKTTIAYCAQRPWILASSVKSNIALAGSHGGHVQENFKRPTHIDAELYRLAVESALIVDDLVQWPAYDDTEVGERGISISGGQKARISLARAVYSDAELCVLDDSLSAVDAHVGKALYFGCIQEALRDRGKGVILVTHQLQYLKHADKVLVLDKLGRQTFYGSYDDLRTNREILQTIEMTEVHNDSNTGNSSRDSPTLTPPATENATQQPSVEPLTASITATTTAKTYKKSVYRYDPDFRSKQLSLRVIPSKKTVDSAAISDTDNSKIHDEGAEMTLTAVEVTVAATESEADKKRREIVVEEDKAVGSMSLGVYWRYISCGGAANGVFVLATLTVAQVVSMITDYWLRWWASEQFGPQSDNKYICIYAGLTIMCMAIGYLRAEWWFQFTLVAASNLHERCLWCVMHSPLRFFISNPTGRILNRFAKDQNQADEMLPVTFFDFLYCALYCLSSIVLICVTIPWLLLVMPFFIAAFYVLRGKYIISSREIKRTEAVTRSPIYADFSATLEGLVTLRAYKLEERVAHLFQQQIDDNGRAWFSFLMVSRWLGFRLDLLSASMVLLVSMFAVILRATVDIGLIGFALVYAVALSGVFQWTVRQSAEVETQMTAIERISQYTQLEQEEGYVSTLAAVKEQLLLAQSSGSSKKNSIAVPTTGSSVLKTAAAVDVDVHTKQVIEHAARLNASKQGHLELRNLTVTYRHDLDPVLSDISADIPAGCKVGICGRTGSGKSSTLLALLRLNIITGGDIVLDGESLLSQDLETARSLVSIIPQEPHLFSGTVRFNLDPFGIYTDEQIWSALKDAHIYEYIARDASGGLMCAVEEGGKNFSVGQRQLLSLARAILRKCKVVLMDEVTASIDFLTDRLIQETIRTSPALRDSTIVTVAHRLRTIADSDLILVVQAGKLVERGHPRDLLQQSTSFFRKLAEESNELTEIVRIANREAQ